MTIATTPFSLPGEVIKIRCSISSLNFNFGPSSDGSFRSSAITLPPTDRRGKPAFHRVIVSAVFVSPSGVIEIEFFPVASYVKPPRTYIDTEWNAATWMAVQSEEVIIQHLPIAAVGWCPTPHHVWGPDPLNFGFSLNYKPAWVLVDERYLLIPVTDTISVLLCVLKNKGGGRRLHRLGVSSMIHLSRTPHRAEWVTSERQFISLLPRPCRVRQPRCPARLWCNVSEH